MTCHAVSQIKSENGQDSEAVFRFGSTKAFIVSSSLDLSVCKHFARVKDCPVNPNRSVENGGREQQLAVPLIIAVLDEKRRT